MGFLKSLMSVISTDGKTGTPFKLDNNTMYWKGNGVTAVDAARAAGFLKGYGYFKEDAGISAQIFSAKSEDPVRIGFLFEAEPSEDVKAYFLEMAKGMKESFAGRSLTLSLLDRNFKEVKDLGEIK